MFDVTANEFDCGYGAGGRRGGAVRLERSERLVRFEPNDMNFWYVYPWHVNWNLYEYSLVNNKLISGWLSEYNINKCVSKYGAEYVQWSQYCFR